MKLPLHLSKLDPARLRVVDAENRIICDMPRQEIKAARAILNKFNRDPRWVVFGAQPYVYTREDWLFDNGKPRC
jgi:hypothetical protein